MSVTEQERLAMARLLNIMEGHTPEPLQPSAHDHAEPVQLLGAGQVSTQDVAAMADVLRKLESAVSHTSAQLITESVHDSQLQEALQTTKYDSGVKIGIYKIQVALDESRLAGRQYYSVVNAATGETLAHELSLYEAAHALVRMLNQGMYFNSQPVRQLMEAEAAYTSHRIDAIRYNRMARRAIQEGNQSRAEIMEDRKQVSMDKMSEAKRKVKRMCGGTSS